MRLEALLQEVEHLAVSGESKGEILEITADSRTTRPGSLFVAIPGSKHDGHDYIEEAISQGAAVIAGERELSPDGVTYVRVSDSRRALSELAAAFYRYPTRKLFTVGITGTKGKTTVAHLTYHILGPDKTELSSTIVNNLERGLINTTPDPITIQRIAYEALQRGKEGLVLEVSAHGLTQARVHRVDFDVAVFTNISHDHLDYYGTMEACLQAKLGLFAGLPRSGTAIVNSDDPHSREVIAATEAAVLTYGLSAEAAIRAEKLEVELDRSRFLVRTPQGSIQLETSLPGKFNIYNVLAAIGVGLARGLPLQEIKAGIEGVERIAGRFERFRAKGGFDIVIDFAHSPDALRKVLETLRPHYRRVLTVFGCGGESDRAKRPLMGQIAAELSDWVIITSDNPKSEDPQKIITEIADGIRGKYEAIIDRRRAIRRSLELAQPGDVILIAGKGHERTQVFADREEEFNDRAFLEAEGVFKAIERG